MGNHPNYLCAQLLERHLCHAYRLKLSATRHFNEDIRCNFQKKYLNSKLLTPNVYIIVTAC